MLKMPIWNAVETTGHLCTLLHVLLLVDTKTVFECLEKFLAAMYHSALPDSNSNSWKGLVN